MIPFCGKDYKKIMASMTETVRRIIKLQRQKKPVHFIEIERTNLLMLIKILKGIFPRFEDIDFSIMTKEELLESKEFLIREMTDIWELSKPN